MASIKERKIFYTRVVITALCNYECNHNDVDEREMQLKLPI